MRRSRRAVRPVRCPEPAVRATIERDGWGGMLWPGHPEWADPATLRPDDVRAGDQLLSLALLKELEPTLVDAGPTPAMAELDKASRVPLHIFSLFYIVHIRAGI